MNRALASGLRFTDADSGAVIGRSDELDAGCFEMGAEQLQVPLAGFWDTDLRFVSLQGRETNSGFFCDAPNGPSQGRACCPDLR